MIEFAPGIVARVSSGTGPLVLWIHGYTLHSGSWAHLWERLPEYTHVGIDLPGHGCSPALAADTTLSSLGAKIADAAVALGIRDVVGLSLGTMVALQVILERPTGFDTLCMGAPALAGGPTVPQVGRRYAEMSALFAARGAGPWMRELWMASPPDLFRHAQSNETLWSELSSIVDEHPWSEMNGPGVARLATEVQSIDAIAALRCRTVLLVGEHEFEAYIETAEILRLIMSNSKVSRLPAAGHLCMLEAPDEASSVIRAALIGTSSSAF